MTAHADHLPLSASSELVLSPLQAPAAVIVKAIAGNLLHSYVRTYLKYTCHGIVHFNATLYAT